MLTSKEEECNQLEKINDESKRNLVDLAAKYQELLNEIDELQKNLVEAKSKYTEKLTQTETDKTKFDNQIAELIENEKNLTAQVNKSINVLILYSSQLFNFL
jgi:predicted  nucleic acid-binding Zn-ribbon protein